MMFKPEAMTFPHVPYAPSAYRTDIEGLRALAVTTVILYHARLFNPGGFIGVDVFFVISGYLITKIIETDIRHARFTLAAFYQRRIRRIFPALFVMFAISSTFAYVLLFPEELVNFGKSLMASAAFVSNIFFRSQIDYFDVASEQKPLLHVWSLAVEEQFYIFWPLILVALNKKVGEQSKILLCAILFCISLLYSEYLVRHTPSAAFYLLPARAWELALGAILAMSVKFSRLDRAPRYAADLASLAGIALICLAILAYDAITPFPGLAALLPCAGAALVIGAGESGTTLGGRLLSLPPIAFMGRISYSLYLWHWPILVFAQLYLARLLRFDEKCWALSLTVLMAYLSWCFVEEPFRNMRIAAGNAREWIGGGIAAGFAMVCIGALIVTNEGFPGRVQTKILEIAKVRAEAKAFQLSPCLMRGAVPPPAEGCLLGKPSPGTNYDVVLWGDSHAAQLAPALEALGRRLSFTARQITKAGCEPLPGLRFFPQNEMRQECPEFNKAVLETILTHSPGTIVLAGWWDVYATGEVLVSEGSTRPSVEESRDNFVSSFRNTVHALTQAGHRVVIIGQVPVPDGNPVNCIERTLMTGRDASNCTATGASRAEVELRVNALLRAAVKTLSGVRIVSPFDWLCNARECRIFTGQGDFVYMDEAHLSAAGAELLNPGIEASMNASPRRSEAATH
jgi:peptidoglycan/LPS O-acetylase OafA/YrhL